MMTTMREFICVDGPDSDAAVTTYAGAARRVYVAEIVRGAGVTTLDDGDADGGARDVQCDLRVPLFCCRAPERKLPPRTPDEALRDAAMRSREGLHLGDTVMLDGVIITL